MTPRSPVRPRPGEGWTGGGGGAAASDADGGAAGAAGGGATSVPFFRAMRPDPKANFFFGRSLARASASCTAGGGRRQSAGRIARERGVGRQGVVSWVEWEESKQEREQRMEEKGVQEGG